MVSERSFWSLTSPLLISLSSQLKSMLSNLTAGQVGGHDEDCVLALQSLSLDFNVTCQVEVCSVLHHLSIGQPPFIKKLKQCGEHIWVGLVHLHQGISLSVSRILIKRHLIEEHHRFGISLEPFG